MKCSIDYLTGQKRTEGWYYIKERNEWMVMKYWEGFFYDECGDGVTQKGRDRFTKIGPRIPMPDEPFEAHYKFAGELGKLFEGGE